MSCVSDWVERLEAAESERSRVSRPTARRIVARRLGLLPGTLENIVRGRVKQMREAVADAIRRAVVHEIERLESELEVARFGARRIGEAEVAAARDAIQEARKIIGGEP